MSAKTTTTAKSPLTLCRSISRPGLTDMQKTPSNFSYFCSEFINSLPAIFRCITCNYCTDCSTTTSDKSPAFEYIPSSPKHFYNHVGVLVSSPVQQDEDGYIYYLNKHSG